MKENNIITKHTFLEYQKKYGKKVDYLIKLTKKEVERFDQTYPNGEKNKLLKGKKWWLINDTYYEIPGKRSLSKGGKAAIGILIGCCAATAVAVPTAILLNSIFNNNAKTVKCDSTEVAFSSKFEADGSLKATITPTIGTKEIDKVEIKIGDYTLKETEYTFNKDNGELIISANVIKAHNGNIVIKPTLKDKGGEGTVTSLKIINSKRKVGVNHTLPLSVEVLPKTATNKEVTWSIVNGSAGRITGGNRLEGLSVGTVQIQATANDGSGVKSDIVQFNVTNEEFYIDWNNKKFTWQNGENCTVYEAAKKSKRIIFKQDNTVVDPCVGKNSSSDLIYACFEGEDVENYELTIWAESPIVFEEADFIKSEDPNFKHFGFFKSCEYATSIELENVDFSNVTDFSTMFYYCSNLAKIDLCNVNASNVTDMNHMFGLCDNLKNIQFGNSFDTSRVKYMNHMFSSCSVLPNLDLSTFDTNNVEDMSNMFDQCRNLKTIYCTDQKFVPPANEDKTLNMFSNCEALVGGEGTVCEDGEGDKGKAHAHIDGIGGDGYLTNKTARPTVSDFINKFNEFITTFNESQGIYKATDTVILKWNGPYGAIYLDDIKYGTTANGRTASFQCEARCGSEDYYRFDANYYADAIASLDPNGSVIVQDDYIEYRKFGEMTSDGIYRLRINKHGYVEEVVEKGAGKNSFCLQFYKDPQEPVEQVTLTQYSQTGFRKENLKISAGTKYNIEIQADPTTVVGYFAIKIGSNVDLTNYIHLNDDKAPTAKDPQHPQQSYTVSYNANTKCLEFSSPAPFSIILTIYTKDTISGPTDNATFLMDKNTIN